MEYETSSISIIVLTKIVCVYTVCNDEVSHVPHHG